MATRTEALLERIEEHLRANKTDGEHLSVVEKTAVYFLLPTFLVGLLGINSPIPYSKSPYTFYVLLVICALWLLGSHIYFCRLERKR